MDGALTIRAMLPDDAEGALAVQLAAFTVEARLYGDAPLPPLLETTEDFVADLESGFGFAAFLGDRLVGSVRVHVVDDRLQIARLSVAPEHQGRGIGAALLARAEQAAPARRADLFTGHLSAANLRLYRRAGYAEHHRVPLDDGLTLVYLRKDLG